VSWAPNGREFAYESSDVGTPRLVVARIGAGTRFLDVGDVDFCPQWSPDGKWIAVVRATSDQQSQELDVISPGGGAPTFLASVPAEYPCVVWSPSGDRIAYAAVVTSGPPPAYVTSSALVILSASGRSLVRQSIDAAGLPGESGFGCVDWSPDAKHLIFVAHGDVYRINADGSGLDLIAADAQAESPTWSPDGSLIAYYSTKGEVQPAAGPPVYGVWVMNADGSGLTKIAEGQHPHWKPAR